MWACRCVERVLRAVANGSAELMVASHNQASVSAAAAAMRSLGLDAAKSGNPSSILQRPVWPLLLIVLLVRIGQHRMGTSNGRIVCARFRCVRTARGCAIAASAQRLHRKCTVAVLL